MMRKREQSFVLGIVLVIPILLAGCPKNEPTSAGGTAGPVSTVGKGVATKPETAPPPPTPPPATPPVTPPVPSAPHVHIGGDTGSGRATLHRSGGLYLLNVVGTSSGVAGQDRKILIYLNAHKGPSGWYLQVPGNTGVTSIAADGAWRGNCQLGNEKYPPKNGDPPVDVAAVVMSSADAKTAIETARADPNAPVFDLPTGLAQDVASEVAIRVPG